MVGPLSYNNSNNSHRLEQLEAAESHHEQQKELAASASAARCRSPRSLSSCSIGYEASLSGASLEDDGDLIDELVMAVRPSCSDLDSFSSEGERSALERKKNFKIRWDGATYGSASSNGSTLTTRQVETKKRSVPRDIMIYMTEAIDGEAKAIHKAAETVSNGFALLKKNVLHTVLSSRPSPPPLPASSAAATASSNTAAASSTMEQLNHRVLDQQSSEPKMASSNTAATTTIEQPNHDVILDQRKLFKQQQLAALGNTMLHMTPAISLAKVQQTFCPSNKIVARLHAPQLQQHRSSHRHNNDDRKPSAVVETTKFVTITTMTEAPIYNIGVDSIAHCLSFLDPVEVLSFVSSPLSKTWKEVYSNQGYLWKVLCLSEPFYAKESIVEDNDDDDYQFRLLYTRFIRCITYLKRIRTIDPMDGHNLNFFTPPMSSPPISTTITNDHQLLRNSFDAAFNATNSSRDETAINGSLRGRKRSSAIGGNAVDGSITTVNKIPKTSELLQQHNAQAPPAAGVCKMNGKTRVAKIMGKHVDLPWSCAVYAIINWMVAFGDVLGIQIACLKALPSLLEDERQRSTAQLSRLSGIVIRSMVVFKNSIQLNTAAFHTLVLLARPIGGKEGMLFHRALVGDNSMIGEGIDDVMTGDDGNNNNNNAASISSGTVVILDSMRRFDHNENLQAMGCWSMVNIALLPAQKTTLVRLGGISVLLHAMRMHPNCADVQFRALFALINLVVPCEQQQKQDASSPSVFPKKSVERQILDNAVSQVTPLVVAAMQKFCTVKDVLNRACLVLHNLSLIQAYHSALLWTPHCYQMLQWALKNNQNDSVIEQSASGTLQRLNQTLADDEGLRVRFASWINKVEN